MALSSHKQVIFLVGVILLTTQMAQSTDPDILSDFILPPNTPAVNSSFFTSTGFRVLLNYSLGSSFTVIKAGMAEFPALGGQSVSYAALLYPAASLNPPHTHPRSAELLFLLYGSLEVGFVDTAGKLYNQTLKSGDLFVFPKGLLHYQFNSDQKSPAAALSAFGSANAGTVSIPKTLFLNGIDDNILALSFKTDVATIQKIRAGLSG